MSIKVTHVQQSSRYWCWAACCEMFVTHYDRNVDTQAGFAHARNAKFGDGVEAIGSYTETAWCLRNRGYNVERVEGPIAWDTLKGILNNNRLIIATALNHAWVIVGAEEHSVHGQILRLHDPGAANGPSMSKYGVFSASWMNSVMLSQSDSGALD